MIKHFNKEDNDTLPLIFFTAEKLSISDTEVQKAKERPFYVSCEVLNTSKYKTGESRKLLINGISHIRFCITIIVATLMYNCSMINSDSRIERFSHIEINIPEVISPIKQSIFNIPYPPMKMILDSLDIIGNQVAATKLANIGEYELAQQYFDKFKTENTEQINILAEQHDAFSTIDSLSKLHQYIFINEAHHRTEHRHFLLKLLPILYQNGYRTLGCEAFNNSDSTINVRNYPLLKSGFYTQDPIYGQVLRTARELGLHIFGYEANSNFQGAADREKQQAKNIIQAIEEKTDKVIIFAGFDHIREDTFLSDAWGKRAMARRFSDSTGINPLTIDQYTFSSKKDIHPHYLALADNKPIIPFQKQSPYINTLSKKQFDYYVVHPQYEQDENSPSWKFKANTSQVFLIPGMYETSHQGLASAYILEEVTQEGEYIDLVPYDVISLDKEHVKPLVLSSNYDYLVVIKNKNNEPVKHYHYVRQ